MLHRCILGGRAPEWLAQSGRPGGGLEPEHLHARERTCTAPPKGLRQQRGRRPGLPLLPGDTATPEERTSRSIDQPQRVLGILHLCRCRGRGGSVEDPKGPHSRPPEPVPPSLCGPDGELRTPCGDHPAGAGHRVRPAVTEAPPKPAEAALVVDLLASRGEGGSACSCRLLPQGAAEGLGLPHASTGVRTRGPVRGGRPAGERRTSTASSRTSCPTRATHCLPMRGLLTDEERAMKERHGSSLTARHDMIVCACSACRGSSTRSWRSRRTATSMTRTRSRTSGHRQV